MLETNDDSREMDEAVKIRRRRTREIRLTPEADFAYTCRTYVNRWTMPWHRDIATEELKALLRQHRALLKKRR